MKKIVLALIMLIFPVKAYGLEDYMIFSDAIVRSVVVEDNSIADVLPVQTIDNTKQIILFKPKKEGKTYVIVQTVDGDRRIRVDVDEYHTEFKTVDGFEFLPCDIAPEYLQIDGVDVIPPPVNKGVK